MTMKNGRFYAVLASLMTFLMLSVSFATVAQDPAIYTGRPADPNGPGSKVCRLEYVFKNPEITDLWYGGERYQTIEFEGLPATETPGRPMPRC